MSNIADISAFEALQNQAHVSMGISPMAVFNDTALDKNLENGRFDDAKYHPKLLEGSLRALLASLKKNKGVVDRGYEEATRHYKKANEAAQAVAKALREKDYKTAFTKLSEGHQEAKDVAIFHTISESETQDTPS